MARTWLAFVVGAVVLSTSGCAVMDGMARHEQKEGTDTKYARTAEGDVKPVEFKRTYTGKLIGPDGKVFRSEPSAEELRAAYGN